jgi:hypothetical protein
LSCGVDELLHACLGALLIVLATGCPGSLPDLATSASTSDASDQSDARASDGASCGELDAVLGPARCEAWIVCSSKTQNCPTHPTLYNPEAEGGAHSDAVTCTSACDPCNEDCLSRCWTGTPIFSIDVLVQVRDCIDSTCRSEFLQCFGDIGKEGMRRSRPLLRPLRHDRRRTALSKLRHGRCWSNLRCPQSLLRTGLPGAMMQTGSGKL